jgi:hypothetical protein
MVAACESGNMKPDRMITGSIKLGNHHAVCCELEIVEINIPNERAVIMKVCFRKRVKIYFLRWAFENKTPRTTITVALMMERKI